LEDFEKLGKVWLAVIKEVKAEVETGQIPYEV
jgi:hypothetical protein